MTEHSSYHHGNLRETLLNEAVNALRQGSIEQLSLRALARNVGVSPTAPYRHFADKNALLAELSVLTFQEVEARTRAAFNPERPLQDNLLAAGLAYIAYAQENPEKYRLTFNAIIHQREQYPRLTEANHNAFKVLEELLNAGIQQGLLLNCSLEILAHTCWATLHGIASAGIDDIYSRMDHQLTHHELVRVQLLLLLRAIAKDASVIKL